MDRPPGMMDVAREAGVSHITVSRVINGHPSVRPETRTRVEAAIQKLGYRRNSVARALKSRRSSTIGVVIVGSELFELPRILLGVETAAKQAGYWVSLASRQGESTSADLMETLQRLTDQSVEAIAVVADRPVVVEALSGLSFGVPVTVVMSGSVPNPGLGFVEVDQELGARLAVRHLLGLGHRDISRARQDGIARSYIEMLDIRATDADVPISKLSGGNQQKALLARWLATDPQHAHPRRAHPRHRRRRPRAKSWAQVMELCDKGMAVVFITSEMAEALRYSDRVVVLRDRRKVADLATAETDEHAVYQIIAGGQV